MKKYIIAAVCMALIGITAATYMYNKPHQNIHKARTDFKLPATDLFSQFEIDESTSNEKYLDKIIEVSGSVKEVKEDENGTMSISLEGNSMMFGVICQLDQHSEHPRQEFKVGEQVVFKGICTGMLMDVIMVRCVEI